MQNDFTYISFGAPILRKECEDFDENTPLENLIRDMFETMYAASGVGLAGPQIGIGKRIFIVDGSPFADLEEGEQPDEQLLELKKFKKVFINPIIEEESGDLWPFAEGCLKTFLELEKMLKENQILKSVITMKIGNF